MPTVHFPYTEAGRKKAKAAAEEFGGKYVPDKKNDRGSGMSIAIVVGSEKPTKKKAPKKKTPRRTRRNKKA